MKAVHQSTDRTNRGGAARCVTLFSMLATCRDCGNRFEPARDPAPATRRASAPAARSGAGRVRRWRCRAAARGVAGEALSQTAAEELAKLVMAPPRCRAAAPQGALDELLARCGLRIEASQR